MKKILLVLLLGVLSVPSASLFSQVLFTADLDASQETPSATVSNAKATAWVVLSADMTSLTYQVTYAGLDTTFTAAHFHSGPPGVGGPVVHPISFVGNTSSGTWTSLPDSIVRNLLKGNLYLNIHSKAYPGGEIRGQVKQAQGIGFTVSMDGSQETPSVATGATGTGWVVLDSAASSLRYRMTIAGLSANFTASHFHTGAPGVPGPVVKAITLVDSTADGTWSGIPDSIVTSLAKGNLYLNVHSGAHPGGEIRGQLTRVGQVAFTADLDASQETPSATVSNGQATAWVVLSADMTSLTYRVTYADLDTTFTAAHFHSGSPGVGGAVVHPISFVGNTSSGTWTSLPDSIVRNLLKGNLYLNIHSRAYPGGEIRSQVKAVQGIGFTVSMDGSQETPSVATGATGTGWVVLKSGGSDLQYHATIAGLSANLTAAHFHAGAPGVPGPVDDPISFIDSTTDGTWSGFPDSILTLLVKGDLYMNVHSAAHPGGEIRGQVLYGAGTLTGVADIPSETPVSFKLDQNYPNPFNPSTVIQFQVPKATRVSLKVYNVIGQEVATLLDEVKPAGSYAVSFNAGTLASGIYFYRLLSGAGAIETRKMILLK